MNSYHLRIFSWYFPPVYFLQLCVPSDFRHRSIFEHNIKRLGSVELVGVSHANTHEKTWKITYSQFTKIIRCKCKNRYSSEATLLRQWFIHTIQPNGKHKLWQNTQQQQQREKLCFKLNMFTSKWIFWIIEWIWCCAFVSNILQTVRINLILLWNCMEIFPCTTNDVIYLSGVLDVVRV